MRAVEMVEAWALGDIPRVLSICEEVAREWPTDLAKIKLAQYHLFNLDALLRAGRISAAQQVLEMRRSYDLDGVPVNRALVQVYDAAGLPEQARIAAARVNTTLARQR